MRALQALRLSTLTILVTSALILASCVRSPTTDSSTDPSEGLTTPPTLSITASPPIATPEPTAGTVDGLSIYTISELLAARAAGTLKGGPIALRGYWSERSFGHSCAPPAQPPGELELRCHDGEWGITDQNEPIAELTIDGRFLPANGPHLTPFVPDDLWPGLGQSEIIHGQRPLPVPIVVIGHLDDPRAKDCQPRSAQLCADRFVIDRIADYRPEAVPTPGVTPSPTPFPFDSPPPPPFDVAQCAGDGPYSFVGWIAGTELDLDQAVPATAYAAVTRDVMEIGEWIDDPGGSRGRFRTMGRRVCFAAEWETGSLSFAWVPGSAYREWDDGHRTPLRP
jgi:hypothetical protein